MTVQDLLDALEGLDPGMPVRLAEQPRWPFEYAVADVRVVDVTTAHDADGEPLGDSEQILYLVEGNQLAYLNQDAARELGWS